MAATDAENMAVANLIAGRGNKIGVHSGDPGKTDANRIGTLEGTTTWAGAVMNGDGYAEVAGSGVTLSVPAGTTVTHFSIRSAAGAFQRGYPVQNSITINGTGSANVVFNPKILHQG